MTQVDFCFVLFQLVASNEAFEKRLNSSNDKKEEQATTSVSKTEVAELGDEVRRLQALNMALQKNLKGIHIVIFSLPEKLTNRDVN